MQATEQTVVRPWTADDQHATETLCAASAPLQRWLDQWVHAEPGDGTWVAELSGGVVGVVATRHCEVHPTRTWAAVAIEPGHGDELTRRLLDHARVACGTGIRVRWADVDGTVDVSAYGLQPVVRCVETEIPGSEPMIDAWSAYAAEHRVRVRESRGAELTDALRRQYEASHRWDPPAPLDGDRWRRILTGDAIPGTGRLAEVDGRIVAAAILHPASSASPCDAHLAFCGPVDPYDAAAVAATAGLLAEYGRWIGRISVECDAGNSGNTALAAALGAEDVGVPGSVVVAVA